MKRKSSKKPLPVFQAFEVLLDGVYSRRKRR